MLRWRTRASYVVRRAERSRSATLRCPVTLLPALLFEAAWELLWLCLVASPKGLDGSVDAATINTMVSCSVVVLIIAVIP